METATAAELGSNAPFPNREYLAFVLKQTAQLAYLEHHPRATRAVRRAMHHKLFTVYNFIKESTTEKVWREEYQGDYEAQSRVAVIVAAMACDIAKDVSPFGPSSAFQLVMREFYGEHGNA